MLQLAPITCAFLACASSRFFQSAFRACLLFSPVCLPTCPPTLPLVFAVCLPTCSLTLPFQVAFPVCITTLPIRFQLADLMLSCLPCQSGPVLIQLPDQWKGFIVTQSNKSQSCMMPYSPCTSGSDPQPWAYPGGYIAKLMQGCMYTPLLERLVL